MEEREIITIIIQKELMRAVALGMEKKGKNRKGIQGYSRTWWGITYMNASR